MRHANYKKADFFLFISLDLFLMNSATSKFSSSSAAYREAELIDDA